MSKTVHYCSSLFIIVHHFDIIFYQYQCTIDTANTMW
jgi:hypothetical protein